jgi:hypothetical protein
MTDFARLVVKLEVENKRLNSELEKTKKKINSVDVSTKKASSSLLSFGKGFIVALAGGAGIRAFSQMAESLDSIGKNADKLGVTTNELQKLRFAGELTGVQFKTIDTSIQRFSRRVGEAAQGYGVLKKELDAGNIAIKNQDGSMRSVTAILNDYSDLMAASLSPQEKLRLAIAAFDSEGGALVNTFGKGSKVLKDFYKQGESSGGFINDEDIRKAEAFNDSMTKLTKSFKTFVTNGVTPALEPLTKFFDKLNGKTSISDVDDEMSLLIRKVKAIDSDLSKFRLFRINPFASDASLKKDKQELLDHISDIQRRIFTFNLSKNKIKVASIDPAINSQLATAQKAAELVGQSIEKLNDKLKEAKDLAKDANNEIDSRLESLKGSSDSGGSFLDAAYFEVKANNALRSGDLDKALREADKGFAILENLKESGKESGQILGGLGTKLADIIKKANNQKVADIEAKIAIDEAAALSLAATVNKSMQGVLDANPLVQKIITQNEGGAGVSVNDISQNIVPVEATKPTETTKPRDLTPVYLTMPSGETIPFFGDPGTVEQTRRDFAREALKKGTR